MIAHFGLNRWPRRAAFGRMLAVIVLAAIILAGTAAASFAEPPQQANPPAESKAQKPAPPVNKQIAQAIADLGSPVFSVRDKASQDLWHAGHEAQAALEKVIFESDDFETVRRAREVLFSFWLGIYPDTPPQTVAQIKKFHLGNFFVKQQVAQELLSAGKADLLHRLIDMEANRQVRDLLNRNLQLRTQSNMGSATSSGVAWQPALVARDQGLEVRAKLALRDFDGAEKMLRGATEGPLVRDLAAFLLARNKLDAEIAQLRPKVNQSEFAPQWKLACFLRAKGDIAGAIATARAAKNDALLNSLLLESCEWKELAKSDAKTDLNTLTNAISAGRLARIIAVRNLAGDKAGCDAAVAIAVDAAKNNKIDPQLLLKPLVFSDRVDTCIELLSAKSQQTAFDLLVAQDRMKDAFRLAKIDLLSPAKVAGKTDWAAWLKGGNNRVSPEQVWLAGRVARALHAVGEDDRAQELVTAIAAVILDSQATDFHPGFRLGLIETSVELGRPESTDALAARLIAKDGDMTDQILNEMYGDLGESASLLWKVRRKEFSGEEQVTTLRNLRRLLSGKPDEAALAEFRRLALRVERPVGLRSSLDEGTEIRARHMLAMAVLFHRAANNKMAISYLQRMGSAGLSTRTLLDQGNLYAELKEWEFAVHAYEAAWTLDRRSAAALYLLGWAKAKRGEEAEGRKCKELALLVPLGDGEIRHELIQVLVRLHENEEAARQRQILLRTADFDDRALVQTLLEIGDAASPAGDGLTSDAAFQRVSLMLLSSGIFLRDVRYYLDIPQAIHRSRVETLLRAGKTAEAIDELHRAEAIAPRNVQLSLDCDAILRKQGAASEADALYHRMADRLEADGRDFPRWGGCRNDLAWLSANLDRDLDRALALAQRAVELEPKSAGYLDTLAEVQFRRGNRAEAVRLAQRCIELDGQLNHYKEQLARFAKLVPSVGRN